MSPPEHPRHRLDREISSPVRLSIMALLVTAEQAEFRRVRDTVEVSDSALSKHIATLDSVGYVEVRKGNVDGRPRTWLSATPLGRSAYDSHLAALDAIIGRS